MRGAKFHLVLDIPVHTLLRRWEAVATLNHHSCPVLCLATLAMAPSTQQAGGSPEHVSMHRRRRLVFSGATDGSLAVWDLSPAALAAAAGPLQPLLAMPMCAPVWRERCERGLLEQRGAAPAQRRRRPGNQTDGSAGHGRSGQQHCKCHHDPALPQRPLLCSEGNASCF